MNPNQFTDVTTTGFGSRIMSAIIGVPIGILLVFGSCYMLFWNEGRVDYSKIAKKSLPVSAQHIDQSANGKLISVTGSVTGQDIGDGLYLKPVSAVALQRIVEEYAWVENRQSQSHNNVGGSQTNTTTYTYTEQWVDTVAPSGSFHVEQGHENPKKPIDDTSIRSSASGIGVYTFNPQTIKLPTLQDVTLSSTNTVLPSVRALPNKTATSSTVSTATPVSGTPSGLTNVSLASPQYLFAGIGSLAAPQLGDTRISYKALPTGATATLFGQLNNGTVSAYTDGNKHTLYQLFTGDRQTAITTLHGQYEKIIWILRGVGIGLLWIGLMMLLAPLDTLLSFIPFAGDIGSFVTALVTFPIALLVGGTVILIGYTLHHVLVLLGAILLILVISITALKVVKHARGISKDTSGAAYGKQDGPPPNSNSGSLFPATTPAYLPPAQPVQPQQPTMVQQPPVYPVQAPSYPPTGTVNPTPPAPQPEHTEPQPPQQPLV